MSIKIQNQEKLKIEKAKLKGMRQTQRMSKNSRETKN